MELAQAKVTPIVFFTCPQCGLGIEQGNDNGGRHECDCGAVYVVSIAAVVRAFRPWTCRICGAQIPLGVSHDTSRCGGGADGR